MRSVTGIYFESKCRHEATTEDGLQCKVNELFVVNAVSFTETEAKITNYLSSYVSGEFEVLTEARAKYKEILFSDKEDDVFYKVKIDFMTIDERNGKTKHSKCDLLVQGSSVESAKKNVDEAFSGTMMDYKIVSVGESAIVDYVE